MDGFLNWNLSSKPLFITEMSWENFTGLSLKEREEIIQNHLNYLLQEGVVKKVGDKYRLKSDQEIQKELQDILQS